jgi:tetratricopeptide (TPR) repeat protein
MSLKRNQSKFEQLKQPYFTKHMRTYGYLLLSAFLSLFVLSSCKNRSQPKAAAASTSVFEQGAIGALTEQIEDNPKNAENYYQRGLALHKLHQDSLALNDFKKAISIDSTKSQYMSAVGDLLFEHKDLTGSVKWLERALQRNPADVRAHLKLAKVMIFTQEYPKAFAEVNTVLRNDAFNPEGYFLKGIIYKELKDTGKAISSFQTCINVAPDYREAMIQLGLLYTYKDNPLGERYLENAFKLDTTDSMPLYAKALHQQNKGQYEPAKQQYRDIIRRDPQYADALFGMGFILLQQDSLEKARRQFDLVTKIEPNNAKAYYNRGLCSELMNQKGDAIRDYEQALTFNKDMQQAKEGVNRLK